MECQQTQSQLNQTHKYFRHWNCQMQNRNFIFKGIKKKFEIRRNKRQKNMT